MTTKTTRFFVTKITLSNLCDSEYVIVNGEIFVGSYHYIDYGDFGVEYTGSWNQTMYEEWHMIERCTLEDIPPFDEQLLPGQWLLRKDVKIWTRCYLYFPPKGGSDDHARSVARILLDPEVRGEEGSLKRIA